jgi:hypothetical protein
MKKINKILILSCCLIVSSCTTGPYKQQFYSGEPLPANQIATIEELVKGGALVDILEVDGHRTGGPAFATLIAEIIPGDHKLRVVYSVWISGGVYLNYYYVYFTARPGKNYRIARYSNVIRIVDLETNNFVKIRLVGD